MGTSSLAAKILEELISKKYNISAVFTQPDKKAGRKNKIRESTVKQIAKKNEIKIFQPHKFNKETTNILKEIKPDLIVVAAYGKILPEEILEIPGFGALNVHTSLLPAFRGPSPIQNAILSGMTTTGVTIMKMDKGVDTGDIVSQKKIAIGTTETSRDLSEKLSTLGAQLLIETIPDWINKKIEPSPQDNSRATLCQLIERSDGHIFWDDSAENIFNRSRAFFPWPGIFSFWENDNAIKRIKLVRISLQKKNSQTKYRLGEVFQLGEKIGVQTGEGVIILEVIQPEGKEEMHIGDFINGYPKFIRSILK